ncbi:MAG TPA: type II toxin-antitoxin system prevent-host-death family antitoxin [Candidatus Angelobacter sp.]
MYTMHKAKSMLSHLVEEAAQGKEVIIARGKQPVARLVPIKPVKKRKPGTLKGKLKAKPGAFAPLSPLELKNWGIG